MEELYITLWSQNRGGDESDAELEIRKLAETFRKTQKYLNPNTLTLSSNVLVELHLAPSREKCLVIFVRL